MQAWITPGASAVMGCFVLLPIVLLGSIVAPPPKQLHQKTIQAVLALFLALIGTSCLFVSFRVLSATAFIWAMYVALLLFCALVWLSRPVWREGDDGDPGSGGDGGEGPPQNPVHPTGGLGVDWREFDQQRSHWDRESEHSLR